MSNLKPIAYCMGGIPAAGKTSFVQQAIVDGLFPHTASLISPDKTMEELEGFKCLWSR